MKKFIALFSIVLLTEFVVGQNRSIKFEDKTFEELKKQAKAENKLIFIDFYTVWCGPCKKMDKEVFTNDSVADFYNSQFISARIDAEKREWVELAKKYEISVYPTFLFLDGDSMIHRACGYKDLKDFVQLGKDALVPERRFAKLLMLYNDHKKDGVFVEKLVIAFRDAGLSTEKIVDDYFANSQEVNSFSKESWSILEYAETSQKGLELILKNCDTLSILHGDSAVYARILTFYLRKAWVLVNDTARQEKYERLKKEISQLDYKAKQTISVDFDLHFHFFTHDWKNFAKVATSGVIEKRYWFRPNKLNMFAWAFANHIDEPELLLSALQWSEQAIKLVNSPKNINTLAHLLFKLDRLDEAIATEAKAMQMAKETNQ